MSLQALAPLSEGWNYWNNTVEACTTRIVRGVSWCLPSSTRRLTEKRWTQSLLVAHGLGIGVLSQVTFGNPFLSPWIAYSLGITGIVITSGVSYRYLKAHILEIKPSFKHRISCVVFPIVLTVGQVLGLYEMWNLGGLSMINKVSISIWSTYANWTANALFHSFLINRNGNPEELHLNTSDAAQHSALNTQHRCELLKEEREEYESIIAKIDKFISDRPDLKALCERYIAEHPESIVRVKKPPIEGLDPDNIFHRKGILILERNACKYELEERMEFIQRHSEVCELFMKYVEEAKPGWAKKEVLLLEN